MGWDYIAKFAAAIFFRPAKHAMLCDCLRLYSQLMSHRSAVRNTGKILVHAMNILHVKC